MPEKICFKCGNALALAEFYKHPAMSDGYLGKCKECTKQDVCHYRRSAAGRAMERRRNQKPERRKAHSALIEQWNADNPEGYRAHYLTSNAIRDGRLERESCEICGALPAVAHHENYSNPLDVRWLCRPHHAEVHGLVVHV